MIRRAVSWIVRRTFGLPMSWAAYRFDVVRRARHARSSPALEAIRCPSRRGLISIILPVHDGAAHLPEALDSILIQTYQQFELIAVDDGSSDATPEVLRRYAGRDPRVRVLRLQHQGLPRALSAGLRVASGEFLTWTSDDNRLKPRFLEHMVDCLRRHPCWDMVYANEDLIGESGEPLTGSQWFWDCQIPRGSEHVVLPGDPSELNTVANNYVGAAFLYRDRVDTLLGDYSALRFGAEDYDYWMRVNLLLTLRHVDFAQPVYEYRFHSRSLTSRDEELGITRRRAGLMVFEDFRQDFALVPLALAVRDDGGTCARALADRLRRQARTTGDLLLDEVALCSDETPRLWFPGVLLEVVERLGDTVPPPVVAAPPGALRVLVVAGESRLPEDLDPAWDMCITARRWQQPPRTRKPRQGWLAIPDADPLWSAVDVRARSHHLARIEAEIAAPPPPACRMSVVVCTHRRVDLLDGCVASLSVQRFPSAEYEVVVVNNDVHDPTVRERVAALDAALFADRPGQLRLVTCPFAGLSFARNAGIAAARGEVVCFLDDDALAREDWLAELWRAYEAHPEAGVVGGTIELRAPEPRPRVLLPGWDKFWSAYHPERPDVHEVDLPRFPYGANWSARRDVLVAIGGFRSGYGRRGDDFSGGEEIVAAGLVRRLGRRVMVAPRAIVVHVPSADRFTARHVWRTAMGGTRNWYRQQRDLYIPFDLGPGRLLRWAARDVKWAFQRGRPLGARLEQLMLAAADLMLLPTFLRDQRLRRRRPLAVSS
jgi:glycosyltransferase involved in cell wall biosynthesis